jgi:hypothetical protein
VIPAFALAQAWPLLAQPYPGLHAFDAATGHLYFGRGRPLHPGDPPTGRLQQLVELLEAQRLIGLIGAAGSGKSSLALAGAALFYEQQGWATIVFRPGLQPLRAFASAIAEYVEGTLAGTGGMGAVDRWVARLEAGDLAAALDATVAVRATGTLIVVDQFEEFFTPTGAREAEITRQRTILLPQLLAATDRPDVRCLLTARLDLMERIATADVTAARMLSNPYRSLMLTAMSAGEVREAVVGPADVFGVEVDPGFAADLAAETSRGEGRLPLLQAALRQAWAHLVQTAGGWRMQRPVGAAGEPGSMLNEALGERADVAAIARRLADGADTAHAVTSADVPIARVVGEPEFIAGSQKFRRLVCLHVPTFEQSGADGRGSVGEIGTGYQITDDLIVTSRHVVRPEGRQIKYPISFLWAFGPDGKKGVWAPDQRTEEKDKTKDPVVWESEKLDVALLGQKAPDWLMKDDRKAYLSRNPPRGLEKWSARGFPIIKRDAPWLDSVELDGKMSALPDGEVFFDLTEESGFPSDEYWHGASGTPVCRGATEEIVGILNVTRNRTGGHRLRATATCRLFSDPEFAAHFRRPDDEARRRECAEAVAKALGKSAFTVRKIATAFGLDANATEVDVARHLVGFDDVATVTGKLRDVYDALGQDIATADKDSAQSSKEAREAIAIAVQWLVPLLSEGHINVQALRDTLDSPLKIIDLPCAITSVAEIYIAAVERRTTAFWPREGQADWPQGKRHLPWRDPPFEGMVQLAKDRHAIQDMFSEKLAMGAVGPDVARTHLDDFMIKTLTPHAGLPGDRDRRKKFAARELESQARRNPRRYLVCRIPLDDQVKRAAIEITLTEIARDYPALIIARLYEGNGAPEARDEEFWDFKDILPLQDDRANV